jgi:3-deoxy-7-phosphoheptulonate synthase
VTKQGISAIVETAGNDCCHLILRGHTKGTNYDRASVDAVAEQMRAADLPYRLMVDCSHGNSNKDHLRQLLVAQDVCEQLAAGSHNICGVMLESHLIEGKQAAVAGGDLVYGQSITDACISWEQTVPVLEDLAQAVQQRRKK